MVLSSGFRNGSHGHSPLSRTWNMCAALTNMRRKPERITFPLKAEIIARSKMWPGRSCAPSPEASPPRSAFLSLSFALSLSNKNGKLCWHLSLVCQEANREASTLVGAYVGLFHSGANNRVVLTATSCVFSRKKRESTHGVLSRVYPTCGCVFGRIVLQGPQKALLND